MAHVRQAVGGICDPLSACATSLTFLRDLSSRAGMNYRMAFRGPKSAVVVPAVAHWKLGHFAAITEREPHGTYRVEDATSGPTIRRFHLSACGGLRVGVREDSSALTDFALGQIVARAGIPPALPARTRCPRRSQLAARRRHRDP